MHPLELRSHGVAVRVAGMALEGFHILAGGVFAPYRGNDETVLIAGHGQQAYMAAALSGVMPAVSRAWAASGPLKVFSRMKRRRARILRRASRTGSSRPTVKRFAR